MKTAVLLLLVFNAYSYGARLPRSADPDESFFGDIFEGAQNALGWTGQALKKVKQTAQAAVVRYGNSVAEKMMEKIVSDTFDQAIDYELIDVDLADRIAVTFDLPVYDVESEAVTAEGFATLEIDGDEEAAKKFREGLVITLQKQNQAASRREVLSLLEYQLAKFLMDNAIISLKSYTSLLSYFNMTAVTEAFKHPEQAVTTVMEFVHGLKPKLTEMAQDAKHMLDSLSSLATVLQEQAQNAAKFSVGVLSKTVKGTIDVAVATGTFSRQMGSSLYASFSSKDVTVDIESLESIGGTSLAGHKFREILRLLVQLKEKGTPNFILLGGLEAAVLNLLADKATVATQTVTPLLNAVGLYKISDALQWAVHLLSNVQNLVPSMIVGSANFYTDMKNVMMVKLQEGGGTTVSVLTMSLRATLKLACVNGILEDNQVGPLVATFDVNNEADPSNIMEELTVKKDEEAANNFKQAMRGLVEKQGSVSMRLLQANAAALKLLTANGVVQMPAMGAMLTFFGV